MNGADNFERKLTSLFDRQRFSQNSKLAALINQTQSRYSNAIPDDELGEVSAAGDAHLSTDAEQHRIPGEGDPL